MPRRWTRRTGTLRVGRHHELERLYLPDLRFHEKGKCVFSSPLKILILLGRSAIPYTVKKRKRASTKNKLSFGIEVEDDADYASSLPATPRAMEASESDGSDGKLSRNNHERSTQRLGPNTLISQAPRVLTKSAMIKDAQARELLRKEFLAMQERVKSTEVLLPFVFYDGTSVPGGRCKIKKGEHIWLFLDQSRKVGAELGVGGGDKSKREWARVGVDDLMLVRRDLIIPHHYDFYYFLINKVQTSSGPLFNFSAEPTSATPAHPEKDASISKDFNPLDRPGRKRDQPNNDHDTLLEGADDDPNITKVVDRRWYEKNKHIYPASLWTEYDSTKDYTSGVRTDTQGNAFFFP